MKRLKPLLPTLKEKKRYLAFEIVSKDQIKQFSEVSKAIWTATLSFLGTLKTADIGMNILQETYNMEKQKGIIRVTHNGINDLKASLFFITNIENQPVIVRSIGASGILDKTKKYIGGTQW